MPRSNHIATRLIPFQLEIADYSKLSGQSARAWVNGDKDKRYETGVAPHYITMVRRFKNADLAKSWGRRFGTVVKCCKVSLHPYLQNVESMDLNYKPIEVEVREEEFTLNRDMELTRTSRHKENITVKLIDNR